MAVVCKPVYRQNPWGQLQDSSFAPAIGQAPGPTSRDSVWLGKPPGGTSEALRLRTWARASLWHAGVRSRKTC